MADSLLGASAQVTPFNFGSHAVRVIKREGVPWFVASDVCLALGYKNSRAAVAEHLDGDERSTVGNPDGRNGGGLLTVISESGLYALVLRSRKPEARRFAKWVTAEVLPAIRQSGTYSVQNASHAAAEGSPGLTGKWLLQVTPEGQQTAMKLQDDAFATTWQGVYERLRNHDVPREIVMDIAVASARAAFCQANDAYRSEGEEIARHINASGDDLSIDDLHRIAIASTLQMWVRAESLRDAAKKRALPQKGRV